MIISKDGNYSLRPIEISDLQVIQKWRNDKNTLPNVREYRLMSVSHIRKWYDSMILDNKFEMFIMQTSNQEPVGVCGLTYIDWKNRNADLHFAVYKDSLWIDDKYSNIFYPIIVDYAFNNLDMNRIYVEMYEIDKKKVDFFSKKGFNKDVCLRKQYYYDGRRWDSYIYSLLKSEYTANIGERR